MRAPDLEIYRNQLKEIRKVVFDMDGTLINTMPGHLMIFGNSMCYLFGIDPEVAANHYTQTAGKPTAEQIQSLLSKAGIPLSETEAQQLGISVDKRLEQAEGEVFPDVVPTLNVLKTRRLDLSVSSSHPTDAIGRVLSHHNLVQFFDTHIGTDPNEPEFTKGEPHFRFLATHYRMEYEDFIKAALFVGDGTSDMKAARSCSVLGIGRIGTKSANELVKAGATITIPDLSLLSRLIG